MMLRTGRLLLRPWRDADLDPCAAMTADPEVMRLFPAPRDRAQSDAWVARTRAHWQREGFGLWVVEVPGVAAFAGFVGLSRMPEGMPCAGGVEAVWTLAAAHWRKGYAAEAARAAVRDGFDRLGLDEIVACTTPANLASQGVMRTIGMTRNPAEDFDHPRVPQGHALRRHVLYRIGRQRQHEPIPPMRSA